MVHRRGERGSGVGKKITIAKGGGGLILPQKNLSKAFKMYLGGLVKGTQDALVAAEVPPPCRHSLAREPFLDKQLLMVNMFVAKRAPPLGDSPARNRPGLDI